MIAFAKEKSESSEPWGRKLFGTWATHFFFCFCTIPSLSSWPNRTLVLRQKKVREAKKESKGKKIRISSSFFMQSRAFSLLPSFPPLKKAPNWAFSFFFHKRRRKEARWIEVRVELSSIIHPSKFLLLLLSAVCIRHFLRCTANRRLFLFCFSSSNRISEKVYKAEHRRLCWLLGKEH